MISEIGGGAEHRVASQIWTGETCMQFVEEKGEDGGGYNTSVDHMF